MEKNIEHFYRPDNFRIKKKYIHIYITKTTDYNYNISQYKLELCFKHDCPIF